MPKKLIEVALPLEAINVASAREKSIRHGHPSTLHLWWSRKPLAACRAVLFASLVDDPSANPDEFPTEAEQDEERQRLFRIIERLVQWENTNNHEVLKEVHAEILKSTHGNPPAVLDPFCGGGSIPLEAQRLGLEAHGSDLNPVAVLITKTLIEIPPKFAGRKPINPEVRKGLAHSGTWNGMTGLAEDIIYYGKWMRTEAAKRIGQRQVSSDPGHHEPESGLSHLMSVTPHREFSSGSFRGADRAIPATDAARGVPGGVGHRRGLPPQPGRLRIAPGGSARSYLPGNRDPANRRGPTRWYAAETPSNPYAPIPWARSNPKETHGAKEPLRSVADVSGAPPLRNARSGGTTLRSY